MSEKESKGTGAVCQCSFTASFNQPAWHDAHVFGAFHLCASSSFFQTADREGNFMQLDQLLPKAEFPVALLSGGGGRVGASASAHTLCDVRDGWNDKVLRLSDEKVVAWLRKKATRMVHSFKSVVALKHLYSDAERASPPEPEPTPATAAAAGAVAPAPDAPEEKKEAGSDAAAGDSTAAATPAAATAASAPAAAAASASLKQSLAFLSEYLPPRFFLLLLSSYSLSTEDVFEKKRAAARWGAEAGGRISGDIDTSRPAGAPPTSDNKVGPTGAHARAHVQHPALFSCL